MKINWLKNNQLIAIFVLLVMILTSFLIIASVWAAEPQFTVKEIQTAKVKYPPYPDVWDWHVPKYDMPIEYLNIKAMDNGDVMISYNQERMDNKIIVRYSTFFEKTKVIDPSAVYKGDYTDDAKSYIPFKDDLFLHSIGGGMRSGGCYDALGFDITIMDKTQIKTLNSKKLLYVYDKRKFYETHSPRCMDGPSFYYRVESVAAHFLPLKDGTFLLLAPAGYIIRFDENFQTKSKLINDKFFWMDEVDWSNFQKKGAYGDRAVGNKDLKRLYNDLYKLLMTKKGGN